MKIETYCLAHQEERVMPYFMRHYTQFSKVILLEGHSTDRTCEIAQEWGAEIRKVDSQNEVNDEIWTDLKNNCWKQSTADWVIICDVDEYVYHPHIIQYLESIEHIAILPRLFNMMSEKFPTGKGQIYDEVQYGREGGAKLNLFRPSAITDINYGVGCHTAHPERNGNKVEPFVTSPIMTFHMRHLSRAYALERNAYLFSRLSEVNKKHGWGYHLGPAPGESMAEYVNKYNRWFNNESTALIKVI